jgi:carotenoid cleavage dioxygenase
VFLKLGDYVGLGGLGLIFLERAKTALGLVDKTAGGGTANTALACHAGRLLALNEGDMPHALRVMCDGLVEAIGRVTVTGAVGRSFTAHPKLDPATGGWLLLKADADMLSCCCSTMWLAWVGLV